MVEAKGLEPSNLLTASQALYQLSYAPIWLADPNSSASGELSVCLGDTGIARCARSNAPRSGAVLQDHTGIT